MKHITVLAVIVSAVTLHASATVRTVSNSPATLAQHSTIPAAISAASNGDTIYVHGSPLPYPTFTLANKRLTFIAPGYAPDKAQPVVATIQGMYLSGTCDSSHFQGFRFTGYVYFPEDGVDHISFVRNKFENMQLYYQNNGYTPATHTGHLYAGNYFENSTVSLSANSNWNGSTYTYSSYISPVNFIFQNNVFWNQYGNSISGFVNATNVLLDHNLFYGTSNAAAVFANGCRYLLLTNNLFVNRNPATENSFATFTSNLTFNAGSNTPWTANSNVDGGGNVANTSPQMAAQADVNAGTANPLLSFTIAAGPANNSATDGKDMGLLFEATGPSNWARSRAASLPFIKSMELTTPTVPAGSTVNISITAQQND